MGDHLLPSNDGKTLWRFMRYEDGPSHGLDWPRDRDLWGAWKWMGSLERVDLDDWDRWHMIARGYETRAEAIEEALRLWTGS